MPTTAQSVVEVRPHETTQKLTVARIVTGHYWQRHKVHASHMRLVHRKFFQFVFSGHCAIGGQGAHQGHMFPMLLAAYHMHDLLTARRNTPLDRPGLQAGFHTGPLTRPTSYHAVGLRDYDGHDGACVSLQTCVRNAIPYSSRTVRVPHHNHNEERTTSTSTPQL